MQTSLRYGGENKSRTLKLHAKERLWLPFHSNSLLQAHAELDTYVGVPSYLALMLRHFFPQSLASVGLGVQCDRSKALRYNFRVKKEFLLNSTGYLRFNIKGKLNANNEFTQHKPRAAAELCWYKFDFQKDQDLRLKVGYEVYQKGKRGSAKCVIYLSPSVVNMVPYFQISENNWTLNYNLNGNWNVRYHL